MNNWKVEKFGNLYEIPSRNGITRPRNVRGQGYKMINMGELFAYPRINDPCMELVELNDKEKEAFNILEGDLLFARQSLVLEGAGKCSVVIKVSSLTTFESHLIRVRLKKNVCDSLYYFYYFKSQVGLNSVQALVNQVSAAGIRGSDLEKLKVIQPSFPIQKKIAAILSTYDDLIENNDRRITLLEKMAEEIYREWFVRLRFPGHEQVTFHKGIPEGWEVLTLGTLADKSGGIVQTGPFGAQLHQSDYQLDGTPAVMPKDIQNDRIVTDSIAYVNEGMVRKLERHILRIGDIILPRRGDLNKRSLITAKENGWLCGTGCLRISIPQTSLSSWYLFYYLKQSHVVEFVENKAVGATMANLNTSILRSVELLFPSMKIQENFNAIICPLSKRIEILYDANHRLIKTRDRLLTRLISGKLSVEDLDIQFPPSMCAAAVAIQNQP